jgi:hypothetical protein
VGWCLDHGQIQQGYTLLQEGIVTVLDASLPELQGVVEGLRDPQQAIKRRREFLSALLNVVANVVPPESWLAPLADRRELANAIAAKLPDGLAAPYRRLTELRNDINHGGFAYAASAADLNAQLRTLSGTVRKILVPSGEESG